MAYIQSTPFQIATITGVAGAALFSGLGYSLTVATVPSILLPAPANPFSSSKDSTKPAPPKSSPGHVARQWKAVYDVGKALGAPLAATSAASLAYACFQIPAGLSKQRNLYAAAAALTVSIVPYTLGVMQKTNSRLEEMAEIEAKGGAPEDSHPGTVAVTEGPDATELVRRWAVLNAGRAALPLIGVGCVMVSFVV